MIRAALLCCALALSACESAYAVGNSNGLVGACQCSQVRPGINVKLGSADAGAFYGGIFKSSAGALANTAFGPLGDDNTGVQFPAADTMNLVTNGATACQVTATQVLSCNSSMSATVITASSGFSSSAAGAYSCGAASGQNCFQAITNGARIDFGAGASDYASSDGTTVSYAGPIASAGSVTSSSATAPQFTCTGAGACELRSTSSGQTTRADCTGTCTVAIGDGTATTVIVGRSGQTTNINGSAAFGTREFLLDKVSSGIGAGNLLATGTNYSGYKIPQAWTLTNLSINVTTASTATAANTVFTATDGTNTCTFTFACNTVTNTTGVKNVAGVNGAGTGCVYAAAALITLSVTTQGCATAATVNSISTWGKPQ